MTSRKFPDPAPAALPPAVVTLGRQLSRLPGIGERTGMRLAIHCALAELDLPDGIAEALSKLHGLGRCVLCQSIAERVEDTFLCSICRDHRRDPGLLCIVGRVPDMLAIERSGAMRGRYFVLGRLISPLDGMGPEDLPLDALKERLTSGEVQEAIIATPTSVEGEATALFLARALAGSTVRMTRLASGVPHGGALEESDQVTLGAAIVGRTPLE